MDSFYSFLEKNSYYVVLIITLLIWLGMFFYLFRIDKKIQKIENQKN
jgi:CcmD family protein